MAVLPIVTYPDPRLMVKSSPVRIISMEIRKLLDDMVETMYAAPGVGLAAPQVGHNVRAIVVDISAQEEDSPGLIRLLNPEIIYSGGEQIGEEGCLSIPGFVSLVKRREKVRVKGLDEEGKYSEYDATGLLARALQHEIDHIEGILFIDRLSRLKRGLFKKRIDKAFGKPNYAAF